MFVALALGAASGLARADGGQAAELTVLEVQSAPGCPAPTEVEAEIRWRAPAARIGPDAPRRLRIELARAPRGFVATMTFEDHGAAASPRQVRAPSCADVASAVALIAALTLDPDATTAPRALAPPPLPVGPTLELPSLTPPPPPAARPGPAAVVAAASSRPRRRGLEVGVAGEARLAVGATPAWLLLGGIAVGVRPRDRRWSGSLGVAAGSVAASTDGVRTEHALMLGRAAGCAGVARMVEVRGCALADLGWHRVAASDVPRATTAHRLWLAVGARAELRYPARGGWYALLGAELVAPLTRDRFVITPATTVHQAPALVPGLGLGLGLRR